MTQQQALLELLRQGPVTPLKAWVERGIYRPADPVERLRNKGYEIKTIMKPTLIRRDGVEKIVNFAEYRLLSEPKRKRGSNERNCD